MDVGIQQEWLLWSSRWPVCALLHSSVFCDVCPLSSFRAYFDAQWVCQRASSCGLSVYCPSQHRTRPPHAAVQHIRTEVCLHGASQLTTAYHVDVPSFSSLAIPGIAPNSVFPACVAMLCWHISPSSILLPAPLLFTIQCCVVLTSCALVSPRLSLSLQAVNGVTEGRNEDMCTHTQYDEEAWWEVDLGTICSIDRIIVFSRQPNSSTNFAQRICPYYIMGSVVPFSGFAGKGRCVKRFPCVYFSSCPTLLSLQHANGAGHLRLQDVDHEGQACGGVGCASWRKVSVCPVSTALAPLHTRSVVYSAFCPPCPPIQDSNDEAIVPHTG